MAHYTPADTTQRLNDDFVSKALNGTCPTKHEQILLDDPNIDDALLPMVGDLNKESLETNSCEKDREPENEDESQSIDLSVSPMKGRENVQPVEIYDESEA